jgi:kumamolisin
VRRRQDRSLTARRVASLYGFPRGLDGSGQCIALLAFNTPSFEGAQPAGGFREDDLALYFRGLGLRAPRVEAVPVAGGANLPDKNPRADLETTLGISIAGAIAPGARLAVYFAPNSERGFHAALCAALEDQVRRPSIICISWGAPETSWTRRVRIAVNATCRRAAALGVTIVVASGDHGSRGRPRAESAPRLEVDFPASSPWVLAVGGTRLLAPGAGIRRETVWNEGDGWGSGGGYSAFFPRPAWQHQLTERHRTFRGRGVPDVAANAAFDTGYRIVRAGQSEAKGGTSAAAPLWAGLIALLNQGLGRRVGHLNPLLYGELAGKVCRPITSGNNGRFRSGRGWNPCTGWGSPDGARLLAALRCHVSI